MRVLLSFVMLLLLQSIYAQQRDIKFKHLSLKDGLSEGTVRCITKDRTGFMWFGTKDGLNRYDGYKFTVYQHNPANPNSIISSHINDVFEDSKGNLWIGTIDGLDKLDRKKDIFIHYRKDSTVLDVRDINEDSKGRIWVATGNAGLYLFNPVNGTFKGYLNDPNDKNSITHNEVNKILEYSPGILWLATRNGLDQFNPQSNSFIKIRPDSTNPKSISGTKIRDLYKDRNGNIWLSMHRSGIAFYNKKDNSFTDYKYDPNNPNGIPEQFIVSLCEGPDGKIWLGTERKGLSIFDPQNETFSSYLPDVLNPTSISSQAIQSFLLDDVGNMWIGTSLNGLNLVCKNSTKFAHYTQIPCNKNSLSSKSIFSIIEDSSGVAWIGTDGGGLNALDRKKNKFTHYSADSSKNSISTDVVFRVIEIKKGQLGIGYGKGGGFDLFDVEKGTFKHHLPQDAATNSKTVAGKAISSAFKDHEGNIWIGSWGSGLNSYNLKTQLFSKYSNNGSRLNTLSSNSVISLFEDKDYNLWVGTENGFNLFNKKDSSFTRFYHDFKNLSSISNNHIYSIREDKAGNLWIGTGGGLNLMNRKNNTFIAYTMKDGLPNNVIKNIEEDRHGNLWLSTNKGIARFNPKTKSIRIYDVADGLQDETFQRGASFQNIHGEIYVGGENGFNVFHPDSLQDNEFIPPVVLTDFQIFNKKVAIDVADSPLKEHITLAKEIILSYKESVFSFEFAALNYSLPEKNQFAYMMEGFDKNWTYVGNKRSATYTNLDPGEYVFKVKASNNDGIWNEEGTSIKIIITPPFWKTWWFITLVAITVIGSAFAWYRARINAIKRQKEELEHQVIERTAEIVMQKEEIETQAEYLLEANKEIKDSIRAAEVIQQSILPSENFIKKHLPESFIFYRPKDVVSGDFYWFDVKEDKIIIAAVDCTGHGVSGAFMSINGHHLLNQAIDPYSNPTTSDILNRLNDGIIKEFHYENENQDIQDGMDIALCILDKEKMTLQFSGAINPLYILRGEEIIQLKANRFAIGLTLADKVIEFTKHDMELQKGDKIYLFSDGYADQIGGEFGQEKFLYSRFRELLLQTKDLPMEKQLETLEESFEKWKGNCEQLDDILVIGFKI